MIAIPVRCRSTEWSHEQPVETPFDELILSWNGFRPTKGYWVFWVSLFQNEWSPWLKYAEWGHLRQATFRGEAAFMKTHQDVAAAKNGLCTAFRIRIEAKEGASLEELHSLTASFTEIARFRVQMPNLDCASLQEPPRKSQMVLGHPRHRDLCSPTSTAAAAGYLGAPLKLEEFAEAVRDQEFDIYGNWILNAAAAYDALGGKYRTYVARLDSFAVAHAQIAKGLPVVLSVKGPLSGSPQPYAFGHLLLLTGYDSKAKRILCMDPAFPSDAETEASYALEPFLEAWARRRNLAYIFSALNVSDLSTTESTESTENTEKESKMGVL